MRYWLGFEIALAVMLVGCVRTNGGSTGAKDPNVTQGDPDAASPPRTEERDAGEMADGGSAGSAGRAAGGSAGREASGGNAGAEQGSSPIDAGRTDPPGPQAPVPCDELPDVVDKVDLLFAIDNSGSMAQEQASLRAQFPRLVQVLTSGDLDGDGEREFPPATDMHLGVVSSDLGLVNIQDIDKCEGLGDDGILLNFPSAEIAGCQASYPRFLTYQAGVSDPTQTALDFSCIAALGTEGCGFEQQLEAALKALWPSQDNRITFLGDSNGFGREGQGDTVNAGFLRNDPVSGRSLIAVILVTDEEDCSSRDTSHFTPMHFLPPDDPLAMQDLNLRCFYNPRNLYPLERYVKGLQALRPENPALVVFGAIVGVPPSLVSPESLGSINWNNPDQRDAFYAQVLSDPRMVEQVDPTRTPAQGQNLVPSCNTDNGRAYPPRRIVQTAQMFGENGVIQSICSSDFSQAMDAILTRIGKRLQKPCGPMLE
jgi:hypothetical protein